MDDRGSTVVVGVDGSAASTVALRVAFTEARLRGGEVEMVTAWAWSDDLEADRTAYRSGRAWAVAAQVAALAGVESGSRDRSRVASVIVDDDPAEALTRAGRGAACIVIGHAHDRHDGQRSVGSRCRELAACPVMEVPETLRVPGQRRASVTPGASFAGGPR
ncbi:MAG: universal stress protein [Nocardioidaceae bacterium]